MSLLIVLSLSLLSLTSSAKVSWTMFNGDPTRTGINLAEYELSPSTVGQLALLWNSTLPEIVDSAPLFFPEVATPSGVKDLLVLSGRFGTLMVVDASNGQIVWQNYIAPGKGGCGQGEYSKSTPVIDEGGLFVYAYRLDGAVHKYNLSSGVESKGNGFPAVVTIVSNVEQVSSSLNLANGYLYATLSGYNGDCGHYVGHVVSVQLSTGVTTVWNSLCTSIRQLLTTDATKSNYCTERESGIWGRSGAVLDPEDNNILVATGNGLFEPGKYEYLGDSVIKLSAGLPLTSNVIVDTYTPTNFQEEDERDLDLGSAAPCIVPVQPTSKTPFMLVQASKDSFVRLIDRSDMSGAGCCGNVGGEIFNISITGMVFTAPLAWTDTKGITWVFVVNGHQTVAYNVVTDMNGVSSLKVAYTLAFTGTSPILANDVLYIQGTNSVVALNPTTGATLWKSIPTGNIHWQSPIVVNGRVYATNEAGALFCFAKGKQSPPQ